MVASYEKPSVASITTRDVAHFTSAVDGLSQIVRELKEIVVGRPDLAKQVPISSTIQYILDYRERYFVFIISPVALTLSIEDYGTLSIAANNPVSLPYPPSTRIFATNITGVGVQQIVYILCTDHPTGFYSGSAGIASNINISQVAGSVIVPFTPADGATNPTALFGVETYPEVWNPDTASWNRWTGGITPLPVGATPTTNNATATAGTATATLTGAASQFTWLTGIFITIIDTATGGSAELSLTGVVGGTIVFEIDAQGVANATNPYFIPFTSPLRSSAVNTNIVATLPTLGAGTGKVSLLLTGYLF